MKGLQLLLRQPMRQAEIEPDDFTRRRRDCSGIHRCGADTRKETVNLLL
jgi:hypothetical protein